MSDLNELFKQLAEEKAKDPKYQQQVKIKESVKGDLGTLFEQLSEEKAKDPKVQAAKKLEKEIKEHVKADLGSLFSELASLKKQKDTLIEEHPELIEEVVENTTEFTPELVEEVITEIAPLPTPIGNVPDEIQIPDIDKYLKAPKQPQQEEPTPYSKEFKTVNDKIKFLEQWIGKIQNTGPGSGEVNLRYLDDVDRSSIGVGKYLTYNPDTKKFYFQEISGGGVPQVQSDWAQTDNTSVSYIKNKPTVVTDVISSDNTVQISATNGVHDLSVAASLSTSIDKVFAYVTNQDSVTIHKGDPVYLYRATGNRPSVIQANNTSDQYSAKTLGLASQDINPGNPGWVQTQGVLTGVDTSMYAEGDTLYLGSTSGTLTNVKPHSPNHLVYIGVVVRANQGQGQIYIKPQNGYELEELHNVNIDHLVALTDGQFLKWSAADHQWVNADLPNTLTWTNSVIAPGNNFKTIIGAQDGYASITILDGVPPYLNSYSWKFDKTKITFPDNSTQTTAWTGTYSYNNLTDKPTIPSLTGYATETFVNTAITNVVGAAPAALDTLKEIADQLATDESAVSSLTTTVAGKVSLTGSYANPAWITSLAYSKLTGAPSLATVATSGSYTDLTNKPSIPTVPTVVSAFGNDSGYIFSNSPTPAVAKLPFNSAIDTVLAIDNLKFRISNQGGVFPQIASNIGSQVDICYTCHGTVAGDGNVYAHNSGYLLAGNGTWLSVYSTHGLDTRADRVELSVTDKNAGKIYRVTYLVTNNSSNTTGYNIIVERIL